MNKPLPDRVRMEGVNCVPTSPAVLFEKEMRSHVYFFNMSCDELTAWLPGLC